MLSVGLDTHLKMHQVEVQNERRKVMWRGRVTNDRKGFNELLGKLKKIERSNGDAIAGVFINPTSSYHLPIQHFLESNGYVVYYVDPRVSNSARRISNLGKEKSDPVDAHILASTPWDVEKAMERKPHIRPGTSQLTRLLESVKKNSSRIINMLSADLGAVFPEFLDFFPDISKSTPLALLERYSTPENIARAGVSEVFGIMNRSSRGQRGLEDAQELLHIAEQSIGIPDVDGTYAFRIRENVKRLRAELDSIREIEEEILEKTEGNEDVKRIDDIRGIGPMNAATIVSEIGPIEQFDSALKLQSYGGKAPTMKGSGGRNRAIGLSKVRNPHLSNAIYECAVSLVRHGNEEFLDIFNREINKGKNNKQACVIVGRRLLYHIFTIMKNRKPYRQRLPGGEREGVSSTGS